MLDLIWPRVCLGCGQYGAIFCGRCSRLKPRPVSMKIEGVNSVYGSVGYASPVANVVRRAKYKPDRSAAVVLARALGSRCLGRRALPPVDAVVPVDTSAWARLRRGFSLPALLAHEVAQARGVKTVRALRATHGARQAGLSKRQRASGVRGRFRAVGEVPPRVLLVDDVLTTGATAAACADELLCAGARVVYVLVLCVAFSERQDGSTPPSGDLRVTM